MARYLVHPIMYASCNGIEVEADSIEEALQKAEEQFEPPSLCWSCANDIDLGDTAEFTELNVEIIKEKESE